MVPGRYTEGGWEEAVVKLVLGAIGVAVLLGYLGGGRLSNLGAVKVRWPQLAMAGMLLQVIPAPRAVAWLGVPMLVLSFLLLGAFALANVRLPGFAVLLVGVLLNLLPIALNDGMPVTVGALRAAGETRSISQMDPSGGVRYHLAGPHERLVALGDSIGGRWPVHYVVSAGDLLIFLSLMAFVVWAMRRKPRMLSHRVPVQAGEAI